MHGDNYNTNTFPGAKLVGITCVNVTVTTVVGIFLTKIEEVLAYKGTRPH